ncbi:cAMP-activated global transcriptional regulator CRP [Andreprevotia sp. IGB-42]|uniref:cyclic nucleotide-binding domain-containing protein n=1 Tax=Andreprevotia sp. IGB-42 TaxID=2497473 RepID=UPI0013574517|nr:cyclic nucleotide-binding domain-containing protein [Andreprevotia sp. IGB-42]KAF0814554.1 cAMP-activated global transcriptional regulator CRP [Andreprevotia sp. IGB-42]
MLSDQLLQRLRSRVALLQHFSEDEVRDFLAHCEAQYWAASQRVIAEGEPGSSLYIVVAGQLAVLHATRQQPILLAELDAGDTFGELALLDGHERSAHVDTLTEVRLLQFDRAQLRHIPALQTKLYHNLAVMLAERLRETNALVSMLATGMPHTAHTGAARQIMQTGR